MRRRLGAAAPVPRRLQDRAFFRAAAEGRGIPVFLTGVLKGWNMEESAELACAVFAMNIRAVGATASIPTLEEARQFIHSQKG